MDTNFAKLIEPIISAIFNEKKIGSAHISKEACCGSENPISFSCNVPNDELADEEIESIRQRCVAKKHLCPDEDLMGLIREDSETLRELGITFQQLEDLFETIRLHVNYCIENDICAAQPPEINQYLSLASPQWSCWGHSVVPLLGAFTAVKVTWGGAETCPFQSPLDKEYHGYEYGSHDWMFVNDVSRESLHIGDLLFHQITKHHFFQTKSSKYRVDPRTLVRFFGLRSGENYKSHTVSKKLWSLKIHSSDPDDTRCIKPLGEGCEERAIDANVTVYVRGNEMIAVKRSKEKQVIVVDGAEATLCSSGRSKFGGTFTRLSLGDTGVPFLRPNKGKAAGFITPPGV